MVTNGENSSLAVNAFDITISSNEQEEERLSVLQDLELLDTPEAENFDRITRMASRLFQVPISAVSLTDRTRQWFKSYIGTQGREISRFGTPCEAVTISTKTLVVPDLGADERFAQGSLAQAGIRFYAGAPLTTHDGYVLGAMCVLDYQSRAMSSDETAALEDLAAVVMAQIEIQHDFGRIDPLSGLPNRLEFIKDLQDLADKDSSRDRVAVVVDLAESRQFNQMVNVLGAHYIDDFVKASIRAIRKTLGRKTKLYHVGITTFALLLDEEQESWKSVIDHLSARLKTPLLCNGIPVVVNAAFGVSPFRLCDTSPHDVLRTAMIAVNDAREAEIDYAAYSPDSDKANHRRFTLLTEIREALQRPDQFNLVYQPRVDLRTGVCSGAEALLRWQNPCLGTVSPGEFIPLVEQTALARPVTQWVIGTALQQAVTWRRAGMDIRISINISARNLEEPDFAESLARAFGKYGVPPTAVELEFTESALIRHRSRVLTQLEEVRALGVELAIDDFGTGYSTFSYLHKLPATTVKIDQSFMRTLPGNIKDQTLVRSIIAMAHDIGFRVVAEGVETAKVYEFLGECGCDEVQGYFISRPLPASGFETWIRQSRDHQMVSMLALLQDRALLV